VLVNAYDLVVDNVGRGDQHDENAIVRQLKKFNVLQALVGERRRNDNANILRKSRKNVRGLLHQAFGGVAALILQSFQDGVDCCQVGF
jgi:hypothetical protein